MIVFWLIVVVMVVIALWMIVPALLGRTKTQQLDQNQQNIRIARERLVELETEHQNKVISADEFSAEKQELEQGLLNDVAIADEQASASTSRNSVYALGILIPLVAVSMYLNLGSPQAVTQENSSHPSMTGNDRNTTNQSLASVDEMVGKLEERLKAEPNDAQGWFTLGRSYMNMRRYQDAADALEKVHKLAGDHPVILLSYADALTMARGGKMQGKPFELVKKALRQEPQNPTALWLVGIGFQEQGDDRRAIKYWKKLEPLLGEDAKSQNEVRSLIAQAQKRLGEPVDKVSSAVPETVAEPVAQAATAASVKVSVKLDPRLLASASPEDTVFIFARAAQGPPMPLAVARKQVKDLPVTVTLDDTMAMMPSMKLSSFPQVKISARISKSGQATAGSGDLQADAVITESTTQQIINLTISKLIP